MTAKQRQHQAHKINIANDLKKKLDKYSDLITPKVLQDNLRAANENTLVNLPYPRINFLQEAIFPATPQGSAQGRRLPKLIDIFLGGDLRLLFRQLHADLGLKLNLAFPFFLCCLPLCDVERGVCETPFLKNVLF